MNILAIAIGKKPLSSASLHGASPSPAHSAKWDDLLRNGPHLYSCDILYFLLYLQASLNIEIRLVSVRPSVFFARFPREQLWKVQNIQHAVEFFPMLRLRCNYDGESSQLKVTRTLSVREQNIFTATEIEGMKSWGSFKHRCKKKRFLRFLTFLFCQCFLFLKTIIENTI